MFDIADAGTFKVVLINVSLTTALPFVALT